MFCDRSTKQASDFAKPKPGCGEASLLVGIGIDVTKDGNHFRGELLPIRAGIQAKQALIQDEHRSYLLSRRPQAGHACELFHAADFGLKRAAAKPGETIRLSPARTLVFFETLDPAIIEQAAQSTIEGASAEHDAAGADLLDILKDRIAVTRMLREAEQNQENGFGERSYHMALYDMSLNDILTPAKSEVKENLRMWLRPLRGLRDYGRSYIPFPRKKYTSSIIRMMTTISSSTNARLWLNSSTMKR